MWARQIVPGIAMLAVATLKFRRVDWDNTLAKLNKFGIISQLLFYLLEFFQLFFGKLILHDLICHDQPLFVETTP